MSASVSRSTASASGGSTDNQWREHLRDGTSVLIRPIRPTDEGLEREFIERLSPRSRHYRFLGTIKTPSAQLLRQFTHPELSRGVAYVAIIDEASEKREIGVARYGATPRRTQLRVRGLHQR